MSGCYKIRVTRDAPYDILKSFFKHKDITDFWVSYELSKKGKYHLQGFFKAKPNLDNPKEVPQKYKKYLKRKCPDLIGNKDFALANLDPDYDDDPPYENYMNYICKEILNKNSYGKNNNLVYEVEYEERRATFLKNEQALKVKTAQEKKKKNTPFNQQVVQHLLAKYPICPEMEHKASGVKEPYLFLLAQEILTHYAEQKKCFPNNIQRAIIYPYLWELGQTRYVIRELTSFQNFQHITDNEYYNFTPQPVSETEF